MVLIYGSSWRVTPWIKKCYSWCHKETDTLSLAVHFHPNIDTMGTIASLPHFGGTKNWLLKGTTEESIGS
jgi:hypothetical protein